MKLALIPAEQKNTYLNHTCLQKICSAYDKKNAVRSDSVQNQNTDKVYIDGSKLDGRVGAGFMQNTQTTPQASNFFTLEYTALCSSNRSP